MNDAIPFLELMNLKGIEHVEFANLTELGRAESNKSFLHFSDQDKELFSENMEKFLDKNKDINMQVTYPDKLFSGGCPAIVTEDNKKTPFIPRISSDGNVYLCQRFTNELYSLGNIHTKSLTEIMKSREFSNFVYYCRFGTSFMSSCTNCIWKSTCGKGCVAMILNNKGFQNSNDGDCYFRKKAFLNDFMKYVNQPSRVSENVNN